MPSTVPAVLGSLVALMTKVLAHQFMGASWHTWRTLLRGVTEGLDHLDDDGRALVKALTGRERLPDVLRELWIVAGRRSGKSIIAALLAIWAATCRTYRLAPGEVPVCMVVAADRRQARVIKRYIAGLLRSTPVLEALIASETRESIILASGVVIEIHTASFRTLRGYTVVFFAGDEVAFWDGEDSASPDREILVAVRAAMATVPDALLVMLSSPYARRGEVWKAFEKHHGRDDSPVLVVNAPTTALNPTVAQSVIDAAYEDDEIAAAAEYGGEFRRDVERFLPLDVLEGARMLGRLELPPLASVRYRAFVDPAGGTGADAFTLAIAHTDERTQRQVLDVVREQRPPFSPENTVQAFVSVLRQYQVREVTGDRYAGDWPAEQFRKCGVTYRPSERTKSEIYKDALPLLTSGRVELLDQPRLLKQLGALERRTGRSGRDAVDHPPRQHDDVANAACGALALGVGGFEAFTMRISGF